MKPIWGLIGILKKIFPLFNGSPETRLKCQSTIKSSFGVLILEEAPPSPQEGHPWGWELQFSGTVLQLWTVRLNVLLFLESFLIENVNVLSFILAAECSAS